MTYTTMVFEMNTAKNQINKCKSADWSNWLARILLDKLRKWAQPSGLTAML